MDDSAAPITDHLAELRMRVAWIVGSWVLGALISFNQAERIFGFLVQPVVRALPDGARLQAIAPTEIFFTYIKSALLAGFVLTLPIFFWHIWRFVSPGLYPGEKKAIVPFVVISSGLFGGGAVFGYSIVFPIVFSFFTSFDADFVQSAWTMREVFALTTRLFLAFGIAFELPIFVFFLAISGIVSARQLFAGTPYAVLGVFVLAALITPPDFVSQILLGIPMVALYLLGVGVAFIFGGKRRKAKASAKHPTIRP